ncbi:MAG TPA: YHYH protein, partial [Roseimicrobium sp.]|nr:YHYH protein [Roseimicrobium sp.]
MKTIRYFLFAAFCLLASDVLADPLLTTWMTNYSGQYARVYTTTANRTSDTSATTWTSHSSPSYADVAQVLYSSSWVYIRTADLPSYRIGPWLNPQGAVGSLWPSNQYEIHRIPRTTSVPATKIYTGAAYSGVFVNGVGAFNFTDGKAWTGSAFVNGPHFQTNYYWHRSAPEGEDYNFDYTLGHQTPQGIFHSHQQPIALRYQLGDHVDYNSSTKRYTESASTVTNHSPILGWSYDGYPIYGPYGYSISNNASSGVRRMVSGYVKRDGSNGTDMVSTNLSVIPAWYARFRQSRGASYSTTAGTSRTSVSGTNTLGTFAQDWAYLGDLTNSATGQLYVRGTNTFDLDVYNGRYCVTPEYPSGTYAYFVTIDSSNASTYPYVFAFEYYGNPNGDTVTTISETVTTNFYGGGDFALKVNSPSVNTTNFLVTLTWSSTEGGTYKVESSADQSNWTVEKTNVSATVGVSTGTNYTSSITSGTAYVRVIRTALASYDSAGGATGVVGQTNIQSFSLGNAAPVVANPISTQTATYGSSFSFTFASNTFTDADAGQTLTYVASGTVLTNTGISFNSGTRTFSATTVDATNGGTIAGSYTVQVVATDNGSPALSATNTFTLTISKATASVTPSAASRNYGVTNPVFTGTLSGFVGADSITANYSTTATTNSAKGSYSITATLNDPGTRLGNYTVTTNTGTLTVSAAPMTVTVNSASRNYGVTNPVFSGTLTGVTNSDSITATYTTTATTNSAKGSYSITPVLSDPGSKLSNYTVTTNAGTLTVSAAPMTVTVNSASRNYGATNPVFSGTLTGVTNSDSITATYTTTATTNSVKGSYSITPVLSDPGSKLSNYTVTTN